MKVLFLTDNFPPEYNAPATRTFEHCREWVKRGADVTVITCFPNFPKGEVFDGFKNKWKEVSYMDGIRVVRVWSFITPNVGTFKRSLDFFSFAVTSFIAGLAVKADLIVATSPQFFTALSGCALAFFKRKRWVMEVRDIWPESIAAVGAMKTRWVISLLERVELFLYRNAWRIVVVTDAFKDNMVARGVPADKIFVVKNGVDLSVYAPTPRNKELMDALGIPQKIIVGYTGTHGLAHSLDFILRSIARMNDQDFHFVFIGDGAEKENLMRLAQTLQLNNVTFVDPVRKSEIVSYLSMIDIALVPLRKSSTFEAVIPSKVFESVAMNIPVLLGVNGETRAIIESYGAGIYFEPENEDDFLAKLVLMKQSIDRDRNHFTNGCQRMSHDFNRENLAEKMLHILSGEEDVSQTRTP